MKTFKKLTAVVLCMISMVMLAACGKTASDSVTSDSSSSGKAGSEQRSALEEIKESKKIRMVTNAEFPPFEYKDGDEITGIDIEIANAIADELGVELEITDIAFDACIPSVTEGKADFSIAGMAVTEDRLKNVDFTDSYFSDRLVMIVAKDSDIKSAADIKGKVVGVQQGTTEDLYVTDENNENGVDAKEVKRYPKQMDAIQDLMTKRVDVAVMNSYPAQKLTEGYLDSVKILEEPIMEENYGIAVAKGSDLTEKLNEIIKSLKDSGKLDEIFDKYIGEE